MIKYLEAKYEVIPNPLWWQKQGLMQTATGYGSKLLTHNMAKIGNRMYRIYAICISNCASLFVIVKGERLFLKEA